MGANGVDKPKRDWTLPRPDWAMWIVGMILFSTGTLMVFGLGIGLMIVGAAIMALAIIL